MQDLYYCAEEICILIIILLLYNIFGELFEYDCVLQVTLCATLVLEVGYCIKQYCPCSDLSPAVILLAWLFQHS